MQRVGQRIMILAAGVGSGHNMAAAAIESCLIDRAGVEAVQRLDVLEASNEVYRRLYDDAYFDLVEAVPWLVGWGYDRGDPPFKLGQATVWFDRLNNAPAVKSIKSFRPDVVICTHFLPARLMSLLMTRGSLMARMMVVTTDYDFQGLWLSSPFTHLFVARDETKAYLEALGLPGDRLTASGIPVRPELADPVKRTEILSRYGLRNDLPVLLISAGAAGGTYTRAIVDQTLRMRNPFQAVVVCGRNADLKREIKHTVALRGGRYRVLGYTTDMAALMKIATLFVGKPGGLTSSECMAAGLPMVLIKPIPGQEERNSDFLLEEGAAVRCNYETTVGYKIDSLLDRPERLARMAESARRIGRAGAAGQVTDLAVTEHSAPLWITRTAQKSMLASAEQGTAATNLYAGRRVRTLIDSATGRSAGVITVADIDNLESMFGLSPDSDGRLRIVLEDLPRPRGRRRFDPNLVLTLRRLLADAPEMTFQLS